MAARDEHFERIRKIAESFCKHHKEGGKDIWGNPLRPCHDCVKLVRHITEAWARYLVVDQAADVKATAVRGYVILVPSHIGIRIGASRLEPDYIMAAVGKAGTL